MASSALDLRFAFLPFPLSPSAGFIRLLEFQALQHGTHAYLVERLPPITRRRAPGNESHSKWQPEGQLPLPQPVTVTPSARLAEPLASPSESEFGTEELALLDEDDFLVFDLVDFADFLELLLDEDFFAFRAVSLLALEATVRAGDGERGLLPVIRFDERAGLTPRADPAEDPALLGIVMEDLCLLQGVKKKLQT